MSIWKLTDNCGYTTMKLILTAAVISLLSAAAIPNYTRYIEYTSEKVCTINRQTILNEYQLYCITEHEITLSDYLNIYYAESNTSLCPSGGIYTASGTGETAELTCCVHNNTITETGTEPLQSEFLEPVLFHSLLPNPDVFYRKIVIQKFIMFE